ncbi:Hypothetical protein LUCI_2212 [Lucifera butyrica]|uniref:Uncharacterized protein n=1 Tax=Lucifera butyrica TaxID=1351585 RepID=A0A498RCS6_9FIRM|nr:hypothetical protein [Lucifera butyrica]VBB06968.1 Hypothetical protein LUCI_2212 [Lucifera butyrica]
MKRIHSLFILAAALLFLGSLPVPAQAFTTRSVAVLPPINTAGYTDQAGINQISSKLRHHFRFPYYELTAPSTLAVAMEAERAILRHPPLYSRTVLTQLAAKLPADIVVAVELADIRSFTIPSLWDDDPHIIADVALKCYTYEAKTGHYQSYTVKKHNEGPYHPRLDVAAMLDELTDTLIQKLPFKTIPDEKDR